MLEVLRNLGWSGSARMGCSDIEVHGQRLSDFLSARGPLEYQQALDLLHGLPPQLARLRQLGKGMPSIEPEDIIVFDGGWYLLTGLDRAWEITGAVSTEGGFRMVCKAPPIARAGASPGTLGGAHLAPELRGQLSLPVHCTNTATMYNIGSLLRGALGLGSNMAPIAGSKLYYCIKRCVVEDPNKRHLIFI